jgi:hypothetical protein
MPSVRRYASRPVVTTTGVEQIVTDLLTKPLANVGIGFGAPELNFDRHHPAVVARDRNRVPNGLLNGTGPK